MFDLRQLRSFREVAERGTVAAAARALGYTAPAVSQHITKLESALDSALFDRAGGRLVLTHSGRRLLPIAHDMADLADRARAAITDPGPKPHVVVAGFASAIATIVIPRLDALSERMTLTVLEAEDSDALRDLSLGSVDLVLTQEYEGDERERDDRFVFVPLIHDELRLVLPQGIATSTQIADVASHRWLMNGNETRCALATQRILLEAGLTPDIGAVVNDNTTLLALVAAGHGVAVVPSLVLEDSARQNSAGQVVVADQQLGIERTIYAVVRRAIAADVQPLLDELGAKSPELV